MGEADCSSDKNTCYRLADNMLIADVDGESVVLAVESSRYFSVLGSMRGLLDGLRDGMTTEAMVSAMCAQFDVSREDAQSDIAAMLPQLIAAGLVTTGPTE